MIDFRNLQNAYPVSWPGAGRQIPAGKKETAIPPVNPAGATDVVEISADAAMKGKLNAVTAALAKEPYAPSPERMAQLKEKYAGDNCPVRGIDIAEVIFARIRAEGFVAEGSANE